MIDRKKLGRRSKRKGNAYENKIAHIMQEYLGPEFCKTPASGGLDLRGDICYKELNTRMPMIIDTKDNKSLFGAKLLTELNKSKKDAEDYGIPGQFMLVVHEFGTSNHYAVIPFEWVLEVFKKLNIFGVINRN